MYAGCGWPQEQGPSHVSDARIKHKYYFEFQDAAGGLLEPSTPEKHYQQFKEHSLRTGDQLWCGADGSPSVTNICAKSKWLFWRDDKVCLDSTTCYAICSIRVDFSECVVKLSFLASDSICTASHSMGWVHVLVCKVHMFHTICWWH